MRPIKRKKGKSKKQAKTKNGCVLIGGRFFYLCGVHEKIIAFFAFKAYDKEKGKECLTYRKIQPVIY